MCLVALMLLISARAANVLWWIIEPRRWEAAFNGSWVWPVLGIIFLPWTTLVWVIVAPTGNPTGIDWLWLFFGFLGDMFSYAGGGYTNRDRVPGYSSY
jgi:hypothetical protein